MRSRHQQQTSRWLSGVASLLLSAGAVCAQSQPPPTSADAPLPLSALEISALIREADRNGTALHQRLPEYTYMQKRITREVVERGQRTEKVRLYEAYPMRMKNRHRHVIILVSIDGVPLSKERAEQERAAAVGRMEQVEREESGLGEGGGDDRYVSVGLDISPDGAGVIFGISQFLRQCEFSAPRRAQVANRESLALAFRPRADVVFAPREQYITQLVGEVWIDAADKVVTRLEAWLPGRGAARPPSAVAVYEQMRLPDGVWVPHRIRFNALGQAKRFNGVEKEMIFEFSEYYHFSTTIEGETLRPPKKP
jgi:hypothetical protein